MWSSRSGAALRCKMPAKALSRPKASALQPLAAGFFDLARQRIGQYVYSPARRPSRGRAAPPRASSSRQRARGQPIFRYGRRHPRRAHLYLWRVEPGTRTAPILGHRVVRVRRYPARSLKPLLPAWRQASSACDSALSMEAEPARTRRVFVACSPRRYLRRVGREAPIDRRFAGASIEPI